eukprot:TRINITY_DN12612_c0_g2_i3.p1 TRINITY_DN12612_c0_g2~~TRINITY_DN12612_c0_g2_i3.p1  ORF type:complete len:1305 (-),score=213.01 TRINITY_DN12612_c0_g2_i3:141-4055(-)
MSPKVDSSNGSHVVMLTCVDPEAEMMQEERERNHREMAALREELEERIAQVEQSIHKELNKWIEAANDRMDKQAKVVTDVRAHVQAVRGTTVPLAVAPPDVASKAEEPPPAQPIAPVKAEAQGAAPAAEPIAAHVAHSTLAPKPDSGGGTGGPHDDFSVEVQTDFQEMAKRLEDYEHRLDEVFQRNRTLTAEVKHAVELAKLAKEYECISSDHKPAIGTSQKAHPVTELLNPADPPLLTDKAHSTEGLEELRHRLTDVEERLMHNAIDKQMTMLVGPQPTKVSALLDEGMPGALQDGLFPPNQTAEEAAEAAAEAGGWVELHRSMLDYGDMYSVGESIWDACLFAFTPYVSPGVSLGVILVYILNLFVQVTFMQVVSSYMLENPVSPEILMSLLKFRIGIGHDVAFADRAGMRSMVRQICDEDNKLHLSGLQAQLFADVRQFHEGAMLLVILSQLCWSVTIINDLKSNYRFLQSLLSIRQDKRTCIVCDCEAVANEADPSLISTKVVVKMSSISLCRIFLLIVFVVLPRFVIAICLGAIGSMYLGVTVSMPDLLLNAMALAFIIELDEIFYSVFAPRRIQLLIENFEPTPVLPSRIYLKFPGIVTFAKLFMVGGYIAFLFFWSVQPFFTELLQARDLLCSGNKDFVVAQNSNTGLLYASPSSRESFLSDAERAVLQMTQLTFHPGSRFASQALANEPTLGWLATSNVTYAKIFDGNSTSSPPTIEKAEFDPGMFVFMTTVAGMSIPDAGFLPCRDLEAGQSKQASMTQLRTLLGKSNIPECDENNETSMAFWKPFCGNVFMTTVRTLCPRTCGCHQPLSYSMGAYQHVKFGCPQQCASLRSVMMYGEELNGGVDDACADSSPGSFSMDSETFPMREWFRTYILSVKGYLVLMPGYRGNLEYNARLYAQSGDFGGRWMNPTNLISYLLDDGPNGFWEGVANRSWVFLPGFLSAFGFELQGCSFLTSPDFRWLFSHDLCSQDVHLSIRQICPVSCGCGTMENCPSGCRLNEDQLPCTDDVSPNKEVVLSTLATLLGNSSITSCLDIPAQVLTENCHKRDMRLLRRYCPMSCRCAEVGDMSATGFFGAGPWGCPKSCAQLQAASRRYIYADENLTAFDVCEDRKSSDWMAPGSQSFLFKMYFTQGLYEYMTSKYSAFQALVTSNVRMAAQGDMLPGGDDPDAHASMATHILNGAWLEDVIAGNYQILPNVTFPGPTGPVSDWCAFITHYMFVWLTGIDVCAEEADHQTLFYNCPKSCRCLNQNGCPLSCTDRSRRLEALGDGRYQQPRIPDFSGPGGEKMRPPISWR